MKNRWYSKQWMVARRSSVLGGLLLAAYLAAAPSVSGSTPDWLRAARNRFPRGGGRGILWGLAVLASQCRL
jgi:hypothetical protein